MSYSYETYRRRKILAGAVLLVGVTVAFVSAVVLLQQTPATAKESTADPTSTSTKVADNGNYGTYLDTYQVNGRTISCLVTNKHESASISCDWTAK